MTKENVKIIEVEFKDIKLNDGIAELVHDLLKQGIEVYAYDCKSANYPVVSEVTAYNGVGFCVIYCDHFGFTRLNTIHRPNRSTGTGFCFGDGVEATVPNVLMVCNGRLPHWADGRGTVRYSTVQEYVNNRSLFGKPYYKIISNKGE